MFFNKHCVEKILVYAPCRLGVKELVVGNLNINIFAKMCQNSDQWRGVPIVEICGSQSPWGAPEFPLVSPAFNHTVLYHIASKDNQIGLSPPKPQIGHDKWDHEFVRMPCSRQSLYPVEENGGTSLKKRWQIIEEALQKPIRNSEELAVTILTYNTKFKTAWKFRALHKLFNEYLEEDEANFFFQVTLPEIAKLALALPKLIQSPIPLLKQHKNKAISLSQQQISSILANAFFCTFPRRNTTKKTSEYASYPHINFNTLYECSGSDDVLEKIKSICHYFRRVCTKVPVGVMTFMRRSVPPKQCPNWAESTKLVAGTPLHVNSSGTIEDDGLGLIQVDFANKYLGGGVLGRGCVQEEIRFVICPELLVSMLFTEVLRPNEALLMIGCERYSKYIGYGHTFQWAGDFVDQTPFDASGRRRCAVLAIDALPFACRTQQYRRELITREINKAWVGMSFFTEEQDDCVMRYPGVATGNWGCGAFGGSADLKSLLQLIAATEAKRPMAYYTFGDKELRNNLINMYNLLAKHTVTVGQLYKYLTMFSATDVRKCQLYEYIHQALIDQQTKDRVEAMDTSVQSNNDENETNHSPDLFSSQENDFTPTNSTTCKTKTEPLKSENEEQKASKNTSNNTFTLFEQITKLDEENGALNLKATNSLSLKQIQEESCSYGENHYKQDLTSRLFNAMDKLDDENGKLNFKGLQKGGLAERAESETGVDVKTIKTSDSEIEEARSSYSKLYETKQDTTIDIEFDDKLDSNVAAETKKILSKKITDYFNKKS